MPDTNEQPFVDYGQNNNITNDVNDDLNTPH